MRRRPKKRKQNNQSVEMVRKQSRWQEAATVDLPMPEAKVHYVLGRKPNDENIPVFYDMFFFKQPSKICLARKVFGSSDDWWKCYEFTGPEQIVLEAYTNTCHEREAKGWEQSNTTGRPGLYDDLDFYEPRFGETGYRPNKETELILNHLVCQVKQKSDCWEVWLRWKEEAGPGAFGKVLEVSDRIISEYPTTAETEVFEKFVRNFICEFVAVSVSKSIIPPTQIAKMGQALIPMIQEAVKEFA